MTTQKLLNSTEQVPPSDKPPDSLVPDPAVCVEFGVTAMTLWRWTRDPDLDFPPAIAIRNRNFRSRKQLESFKARMLSKAIRHRRVIDQQQGEGADDAVAMGMGAEKHA